MRVSIILIGVELFEIYCHAYDVLDHMDPTKPRPSDISDTLWLRLDSVVKKWIFGAISPDLLQIVLLLSLYYLRNRG